MSQRERLRVGVAVGASLPGVGEPRLSADDAEGRLERFCRALSPAVGGDVQPFLADGYPALLEAMNRCEVDVAWLPPVVALRAASAGRALPIALPVRRGVSVFHSALFARAGSRLRRPADLRGVRAAWVDASSASGYLVIRAALRAQRVRLEDAFWEERFHGSHAAVVQAVLEHRADVGATFMHRGPGQPDAWRAGWGDAEVHIVSRVGPIPADVVAAAVHVPVATIRRVQQVLLAADGELGAAAGALLEAEGFVAAETSHLEPLEQLLEFLEDTATRWTSVVPPPR